MTDVTIIDALSLLLDRTPRTEDWGLGDEEERETERQSMILITAMRDALQDVRSNTKGRVYAYHDAVAMFRFMSPHHSIRLRGLASLLISVFPWNDTPEVTVEEWERAFKALHRRADDALALERDYEAAHPSWPSPEKEAVDTENSIQSHANARKLRKEDETDVSS
jgi:hypothetical protein